MHLRRTAFVVVIFSFLVLAEARHNPTGHLADEGLIPALAKFLGHGRNLVAGSLPSTRDASGSLNQTSIFKEEIAHDDVPGGSGRRRLLASLVDRSMTLTGGQSYTAKFSGYTCVHFKVTATGDDLTIVNIMTDSGYQTLYANSFSGYYTYIAGSECTTTYSCEKTVSGLSAYTTYRLVIYNNNDGFGSSTVKVEMDDCTSSPPPPSPPPSTSNAPPPPPSPPPTYVSSPSSSSTYGCDGTCPLYDLACGLPFVSIDLGCVEKCGCNDNVFYGSCGAFMVKSDRWCNIAGSDYCCAPSEDGCCDTDDGAVAGLVIGLIVGLTLSITACAWCCKCCCFRPKPEAPVVVQMSAPVPTVAINASPAAAAPAAVSKPDGSKFCDGCGTALSGAAFCPGCGKKQ